MVDLNVRFETSLTEEDLRNLASRQNRELGDDFFLAFNQKYDATDYEKYQDARNKILSLLQNEDAINYAVNSLVHRLYRKGYLYFELAFTPFLFAGSGLSIRLRVKTFMNALNAVLKECPGMDVNVILYCHRDDSMDHNREVADLAMEYKDERIVAVGLEGSDKGRPLNNYVSLFEKAKKEEYPIVIELGANYRNNNAVKKAVELGTKRIVSPYKLVPNVEMGSLLGQYHCFIELRPSLDLALGLRSVDDAFPLTYFWNYGIQAYVSGNSYGLLDATLANEFKRNVELTREDIQHSIYNSIHAAYLYKNNDKRRLVNAYVKDFDSYYRYLR